MKAIARSYVYWPTLDSDIVGYVKACQHCASVAKSAPHSTPVPWPKTSKPWQRIHVDYAGPIEGDYYLLAIDAFSKWPEIIKTGRITSAATIGILRGLFARLGMPETLVTDNGTQFTSADFSNFCTMNGIEHLTTAPFHPQSNGQAERFVDTFKRAIKKIHNRTIAEALDVFLLTYRSTPNCSLPEDKSPSEIMFGRKIRTCLHLLRPPVVQVPDQLVSNQKGFKKNDTVYAKVFSKNRWKWVPGIIIERIGQVMYNVWVEHRNMLRSHLIQLRSRTVDPLSTKRSDSLPEQSLPLNVLLEAWNMKEPAKPTPESTVLQHVSTQHSSSATGLLSSDRTLQNIPAGRVSSTPRHDMSPPLESSPAPLSSPSTSSTESNDYESAIEAQPMVPLPRRSSRIRRPPQWFDPYHLY
ncbi:uncharacterized protein K02A2.6-like [Toxorhynchites rutilus septentrionalis]|uniref:uncharacterized protein K02A2.6-like n=1 Tax=Toxorhynchites rutilus septentrionalis TaxID=329112 RepID=UPI00247A86E8|nr:uncharacterized protein K02A2.6-like [Toxorhynchites rutilus septentrionalis]